MDAAMTAIFDAVRTAKRVLTRNRDHPTSIAGRKMLDVTNVVEDVSL